MNYLYLSISQKYNKYEKDHEQSTFTTTLSFKGNKSIASNLFERCFLLQFHHISRKGKN